jgi:hypothetical protein
MGTAWPRVMPVCGIYGRRPVANPITPGDGRGGQAKVPDRIAETC